MSRDIIYSSSRRRRVNGLKRTLTDTIFCIFCFFFHRRTTLKCSKEERDIPRFSRWTSVPRSGSMMSFFGEGDCEWRRGSRQNANSEKGYIDLGPRQFNSICQFWELKIFPNFFKRNSRKEESNNIEKRKIRIFSKFYKESQQRLKI